MSFRSACTALSMAETVSRLRASHAIVKPHPGTPCWVSGYPCKACSTCLAFPPLVCVGIKASQADIAIRTGACDEPKYSHHPGHLKAQECSVHTVRSYTCDLRALGRCVGQKTGVASISANALNRFLTSKHARIGPSEKPRSPAALNRLRAVLRSFFGWLHRTGQIQRNPACCLRVHVYRPPAPALLTERELGKLLTVMNASGDPNAPRDRLIVQLLAGTGIRISEPAGLDVADVDVAGQKLRVRTKAGITEDRYLTRNLAKALRTHLPGRTTGPLFPNRRGARIGVRHIARRLKTWLARAGIDRHVTPHMFRHTLATRLLDKTGNVQLVQKALGHRSIHSALRYTQVANRALREALEAV